MALHPPGEVPAQIERQGYPEITEDLTDDVGTESRGQVFNLDLPYYEWRDLETRGFHIVGVGLKDMGRDTAERWWQALEPLAHADRVLSQGCYIHCNAGVSRSPTLVWLHLVLGGMEAGAVRSLITTANPHACPGDPAIMHNGLLAGLRAIALRHSGNVCR